MLLRCSRLLAADRMLPALLATRSARWPASNRMHLPTRMQMGCCRPRHSSARCMTNCYCAGDSPTA